MSFHVLVPVDSSERSTEALEFAFSEHPDARITVLHVVDPSNLYTATGVDAGGMMNYEQVKESQETQTDAILEDARKQAKEHGIEVETVDVVGSVSGSIVDYAEEEGVDHVVIGSHGRTGASRILLGSVAETVARRSPVPVTIVR